MKNSIKTLSIWLFMVCVLFVGYATTASADDDRYYKRGYSYNDNYYYNDNSDAIARLIAQINALKAQLEQIERTTSYTTGYGNYNKYYFKDGTPKKKTYNYYSSDYDFDVSTEDYDVESDDTVTLFGEIDLDGASYADVWFEYGTDGDLDEETSSRRITRDTRFSVELDDLDEDEQYYFRAVAQAPGGSRTYGSVRGFETDEDDDDNDDEDVPSATTDEAEDVEENSAELHGDIDMNDYDNGIAFFVYGEDEDEIEDVEDETRYNDVHNDGDDIRTVLLTNNLDNDSSFSVRVNGLDDDTDHFFRICVEYDDEDDDETLVCGDVEEFTTDEN
jgi:hypothetical protein